MKKFFKYLLIFTLPIFITGGVSEFLLRRIPNDYLLKKKYLDNNSNNIKVLFLGSSHAFYGINPSEFSSNSFNAANVSQTLDLDFEILKKYNNAFAKLEYIVIPISYFSLFEKLEDGDESWRIKNYTIYYGITSSNKYIDYSEVLRNNLITNITRIGSYYILGKTNISCSNLGWGHIHNSKNERDLNISGEIAARRHLKKDDKYLKENEKTLKAIIDLAKNKGAKVFLYIPPAFHTYTDILDHSQLEQTINTMKNFASQYDNVMCHNFLFDTSFTQIDYYDADHMNELGSKKLTRKIDILIN